MFNLVLVEPEIPANTGNIIRLTANTGSTLHLIHPLGFSFEEKQLKRAGLDYHDLAKVHQYPDFSAFQNQHQNKTFYAIETSGKRSYDTVSFKPGDFLIFGKETKGLNKDILDSIGESNTFRIPMKAGNRSLNLSNCVALVVYEAWRQNHFV